MSLSISFITVLELQLKCATGVSGVVVELVETGGSNVISVKSDDGGKFTFSEQDQGLSYTTSKTITIKFNQTAFSNSYVWSLNSANSAAGTQFQKELKYFVTKFRMGTNR